jgi:hypothetical protein
MHVDHDLLAGVTAFVLALAALIRALRGTRRAGALFKKLPRTV